MKINNLDCCRPRRRRFSFQAQDENIKNKKVLYKHYEAVSDEKLADLSIERAKKQVQQSGKMKVFKALPILGALVAGTSIALTQSGKTTDKLRAGLGFLMLLGGLVDVNKGVSTVAQKIDNENKDKKASALLKGGLYFATGATMIGMGAVATNMASNLASKVLPKANNEGLQKALEGAKNAINNSKVSEFLQNKVDPVLAKNKFLQKAIAPLTVAVSSIGINVAQNKLAKEMGKDVVLKSQENFLKGKVAQAEIKARYDQIDAKEI